MKYRLHGVDIASPEGPAAFAKLYIADRTLVAASIGAGYDISKSSDEIEDRLPTIAVLLAQQARRRTQQTLSKLQYDLPSTDQQAASNILQNLQEEYRHEPYLYDLLGGVAIHEYSKSQAQRAYPDKLTRTIAINAVGDTAITATTNSETLEALFSFGNRLDDGIAPHPEFAAELLNAWSNNLRRR
ncbi:MAG TPA: hypothetical protein VD735_03095 [Candidatus Saccharimonadales bacterium]|nr:hypothetical protein [Candidatus Saccharimonadales bacterium]